MTRENILADLENIFRDTFNTPTLQITENSNAAEIPEWDSLNNIYLVVNIENHFNIKFLTQDMQEWQNVGNMVTSIEKSLS